MKYRAEIDIMPKEEILDPQGRVVNEGLHNLGLATIENVRIGKHIKLMLEAANEAEATRITDEACSKLLANLIMERYTFTLHQA